MRRSSSQHHSIRSSGLDESVQEVLYPNRIEPVMPQSQRGKIKF